MVIWVIVLMIQITFFLYLIMKEYLFHHDLTLNVFLGYVLFFLTLLFADVLLASGLSIFIKYIVILIIFVVSKPKNIMFKESFISLLNILNLMSCLNVFLNLVMRMLPYQITGKPNLYFLIINGLMLLINIFKSFYKMPITYLYNIQRKKMVITVSLNILLLTILSFSTSAFRYVQPIYYKYQTQAMLKEVNIYFMMLLYIIAYLILIVSGLIYAQRKSKSIQFNQLQQYVKELENLYEEVSTFKHDYLNILYSLRLSIDQQNIHQVREVFYDIVEPTKKIIHMKNLNIGKLINIGNIALRSLIYEKILQAHSKGVVSNIQIPEPISLNDSSTDLLRVLGILLDNAIEAAEFSKKSIIKIVFMTNQDNEVHIKISNTYPEDEEIHTRINSIGESSKGHKRGWGLYNLRQILNDHDDWIMMTEIDSNWVTQYLIINYKVLDT